MSGLRRTIVVACVLLSCSAADGPITFRLPCSISTPEAFESWYMCEWTETFAATDGTIVSNYAAETCVDTAFGFSAEETIRLRRSRCIGQCTVQVSSIACYGPMPQPGDGN